MRASGVIPERWRMRRWRGWRLVSGFSLPYNWGMDLPGVAPMLSYEDVGSAADWLSPIVPKP